MKYSDIPKKMPVPFGVNGSRLDIDTTPVTGDSNASYSLGFPDVTMLNESAGGKAPKGQNINQIFYELSLDARWNQAGGIYKYDSTFSSLIGGYPKGALVLGDDSISIYQSQSDDNTTDLTDSSWLNLSAIYLKSGSNLSDLANKVTSRFNLGVSDGSGYVGRLIKVTTITASSVFTKDSATKKIMVKAVGGGGGSSSCLSTSSSQVSVSSGGGSGSYAEGMFDVSSLSTIAITIGSGGAAGYGNSTSTAYGSDGGSTIVGSFITCPGGKAGLPAGPANPPYQPVSNTNSDNPSGWNIIGVSGYGSEPAVAVALSYALGSRGANSMMGSGGSVPSINNKPNTGSGYGSGASGASNGSSRSSMDGAKGQSGAVIIYEYA